jgi:3-hydroxybutyryl-CoA dehydrogenase
VNVEQISVIGAGMMGAGIAHVIAGAGMTCRIYDPVNESRSSVRSRVTTSCELLGLDAEDVMGRIEVCDDLRTACQGSTLVIEAGPENVAVKHAIFAELSDVTASSTILASNTSAIPIGIIGDAVEDPSRVVGTHFWNPPYLVQLVEVVQSASTSMEVVEATMRILASAAMVPVHVRIDVPGFVGNRMQHALKREAIALVANGVCSAETVDLVVRHGFGRRLGLVGPLEQADLGGTDLTLAIHEILMPAIDSTPVAHPYLVAMVERGDLGAKSGRGFFEWSPGEAQRRRAEINQGLLEQRSTSSDTSIKVQPSRGSE